MKPSDYVRLVAFANLRREAKKHGFYVIPKEAIQTLWARTEVSMIERMTASANNRSGELDEHIRRATARKLASDFVAECSEFVEWETEKTSFLYDAVTARVVIVRAGYDVREWIKEKYDGKEVRAEETNPRTQGAPGGSADCGQQFLSEQGDVPRG